MNRQSYPTFRYWLNDDSNNRVPIHANTSSISDALSSNAIPSDGQILIGRTGNDPVASTITAGNGIEILNTPGSITISAIAFQPVPPKTVGSSSQISTTNATFSTIDLMSLTVDFPGTYLILFDGDFLLDGSGSLFTHIAKNGTALPFTEREVDKKNIHFGISMHTIENLVPGDTIEVSWRITSSTAFNHTRKLSFLHLNN